MSTLHPTTTNLLLLEVVSIPLSTGKLELIFLYFESLVLYTINSLYCTRTCTTTALCRVYFLSSLWFSFFIPMEEYIT